VNGGLSGVSLTTSTAFPEFSRVYGTAELNVLLSIRINGIGDANAPSSSASFFLSPTTVAMNETYTIWQNTTLQTNSTNGVLLNDVNYNYAPDDTGFVASLLPPTNNQTVMNSDGTFTYNPKSATYSGNDTFKYLVKSGSIDRSVGTVTVNVRIDDRPRPKNDTYSTIEKVAFVANSTTGVLANDFPAYKLISVTNYTQPLNGSVTIYPNGSFVYTPQKRFNGNDTFYYTISNSRGERFVVITKHIGADNLHSISAVASVTFVVLPYTYIPVAVNDSYSVAEDNVLSVSGHYYLL